MEEENEFNNANAPAFANPGSEYGPGSSGLTKREYFAAMAMQGLLSNPQYTEGLERSMRSKAITDMNLMCVREAIDMADELLKQLDK